MTYRIAVRDHANERDVTYTVNPNTRGGYDTEPQSPGDHLSAIERAIVAFENQKIERASGNLTVEVTDISEIEEGNDLPKQRKAEKTPATAPAKPEPAKAVDKTDAAVKKFLSETEDKKTATKPQA